MRAAIPSKAGGRCSFDKPDKVTKGICQLSKDLTMAVEVSLAKENGSTGVSVVHRLAFTR